MRTQMLAGFVVIVVAMLASAGRPAAASGVGANVVASMIELPSGAAAAGPVAAAAPDSASSPGHIDASTVGRFPTGYPGHPITDNIVFTGDVEAGILIQVSGALVNDTWRWRYYRPGNVVAVDCYFKIVPAGTPGNTSGVTALISNCSLTGALFTTGNHYPAGCPCAFDYIGGGFLISGTTSAGYPGTWTGTIDYTDPSNVTTAAVVQGNIYLVRTPLVAVLHGFNSDCNGVNDLVVNLATQLEIAGNRVRCYRYTWPDGVRAGADGLGSFLRGFQAQIDPSQTEIDIVAHSMGGLVARYWYERQYNGATEPFAIGSISMLGTPNLGVNITKYERWLCPRWSRVVPVINKVCTILDIGSSLLGIDPHSQAVDDFKPGNKEVLGAINNGFTSPVSPIFRAHVGVNTTFVGHFFSGSGPNDCFISNDSTFGPIVSSGQFLGAVFGPDARYPRRFYNGVSHSGGIPLCDDSNKLTNNPLVVQNLLPDIKPYLGFPAFPPNGPVAPPLVSAAPLAPEIAALHLVDSGVTDGVTNTHTLTIPSGLPSATFAALWVPGDAPPNLTVQVLRPGGTPVAPLDPDVLQPLSMDGSAGSLYVAASGFTIASPVAGNWSVRVTGVATGPDGAPYIAGVFPDSNVGLSANTTADVVLAGGAQTATAQLLDGNTPVPATISARLIKVDGSEQTITLVDDGTNGDASAGDREYSRSISTSGACGTVRLLVSADATGTSEGSVHREQVASFDVHVPGDAVRDPCNPDDDGDGLTDDSEFNTLHTDPLNADSDGDGYSDGQEVTLAENPLAYCQIMRADVDGDHGVSILDLATVAQSFVQTVPPAPARLDQDADNRISILDLARMASLFLQHVNLCV